MNETRFKHRPLIAVDIGNRQIKFGLIPDWRTAPLPHPTSVRRLQTENPRFDDLSTWLPETAIAWCVATVHQTAEQSLGEWVASKRPQDTYLCLVNDLVPIENRTDEPNRVGTDRLLAALAANRLRKPDRPAIVVDAGTAITVDLVSEHGEFDGGMILPGFEMVARAFAQQTDALPLVEHAVPEQAPPAVGKSTVQAIRCGLYWGSVGAVRQAIEQIAQQQCQESDVFIAGGDAAKLTPHLPPYAQSVGDLVFAGIAISFREQQ